MGVGADVSAFERGALALALGAGLLQVVCLALGVFGALTTTNVRLLSGVVAVAAAFDAWAVIRRARATWTLLGTPAWLGAWLLALLPGLLLALLSALTPTVDPDGMGYHLTVPKRWLAAGSLEYLPTYPYSNTPMGVEMLFTLGLSWAGDAAAKLIHFLMGLGAALSLYAAAKRLASGVLPALAVTLLLFGPFGVASLMGWAYVEAATACMLVASGLAWLIWYQGRAAALLRLSGLLAGIGVSFKMTAALLPVALFALTLLLLVREAREQGKPVASIAKLLLPMVACVALPVLPWFARSAIVTGNPFFPMFASLIPSRDFTALQSKQFDQYNRYMVWGVGSGGSWGLGLRKAILGCALAGLALPGVVIAWRQRTYVARCTVLVVLVTLLVQLAAAGLYKRYWIPLLAIAVLPMLLLLERWLRAAWAGKALVVVTALLSLIAGKQILSSVNGDVAGLLKTSLGLQQQSAFLQQQLPLMPLYQAVNRDAPADAGVMLAAYCSGFYIDRATFCADIVQSSLRYSSWDEFKSDVVRLGITHVIAPRSWEEPRPESDTPPPLQVGNTSYLIREQEHLMVGRAIREHGRLLLPAADQGLYALDVERLQ
ncbi:MAG: 4-amino-4-deoxy-L-arabinose transferase and related glycosyltransferase of family-like protein [Polyangiaceae bacterium]|jgi:4-amino-4-deoxy-L-arabinose transferase-like glycosyltransferase|nr:4-amino-4-deoxy-L-arabinose transferase and related glycosyltransferase of family-like protein [Polyangiaceae bacterium]